MTRPPANKRSDESTVNKPRRLTEYAENAKVASPTHPADTEVDHPAELSVTNFFPDLPKSLSGWWVLVTFGPQPPELCDQSVPRKQASTAARYKKLLKAMFDSLSDQMAPVSPEIRSRTLPCSGRLPERIGDVSRDGADKFASPRASLSECIDKLVRNLKMLRASVDKILSSTLDGALWHRRIAAASELAEDPQQSGHCSPIYYVRDLLIIRD